MTEWGGQVHSGCGNLENSELPTSGSTPTICRSSPSSDTLPDANPTYHPDLCALGLFTPAATPSCTVDPSSPVSLDRKPPGFFFSNPFLKRDERDQKGGYFFRPVSKGDLLEGQVEEESSNVLWGRCFLGSMKTIRFDNFV